MTTKKIALFIDADNISAKFGKQIIDTLESRGEIFIRRIYGNWQKISLHGWNECILNYSLRPVQQNDFASGKNATDMSLTIDAMDVLYSGKSEIFALVSNDSDFTPLAIRLRESGMNIIGFGNSNASNAFRAVCNEFIDLDAAEKAMRNAQCVIRNEKPIQNRHANSPVQLSLFDDEIQPAEKISPPPTTSKVVPISEQSKFDDKNRLQVLHDILRETADMHGDEKGFVPLCLAGDCIRKKNLGFSVKNLGYSTLHRFVSDFPNLYEVIQRKTGENFCYRCLKPAQKNSAADRLCQLHNILRETAKVYGDDAGFSLLNQAGQEIKNKNLGFGIKNFGYSTLQKFVSDFPKLYEIRRAGKIVRYRCK